jgi:hypothetical protein
LSSADNPDQSESVRQKEFEDKFAKLAEEAETKKRLEEANKKEVPDARVLKPTNINILDEVDKGLFFDKKLYPGYNAEEYTRVLSTLRGKRQKYITEVLSKRDKHIIPLYTNNGGEASSDNDPLLNPNKPFTNEDAEHVKSVSIEQKEYEFHDASVKYFNVMQDLDNNYAQTIQDIQYAIQNAPRGGIPGEEFKRLSDNLRNVENKRYRYGARLFLRMTDEEYDRAVNLQNIKDAVDAAIHRTAHTIPNYTKT